MTALAKAGGRVGPALGLAGVAGAGVALQVYLNGRLSGDVGSVEVASVINNVVGLVALLVVAVAAGSLQRAGRRVRDGVPLAPWYFAGGAFGAVLVVVSTAAAPTVGVALLTVALVCGQTTGSLGVDAAGVGPAGRRPPSAARVLGVALAVAAVVVSALGSRAHLDVVLLVLALLAGVGSSLQQAINGRLAAAVGEPPVAALVNFAVGFAVMTALAVAVAWGDRIHVGGPAIHWAGGLLGAFFAVVSAVAVRTLGVLRLMLVVVAGQTAGALLIDLLAPVRGQTVGLATVAGVVLTLLAVAVSGRGQAV